MNTNIVFLGDSITDAGRNLTSGCPYSIGQGYAMIVQAKLGSSEPRQHKFFNFGVSGERVVDVYAQIKTRCWNNTPDVVSLFVGINDVLHEYENGNGVDADRFDKVYRMLLSDTLSRFPKVKFILIAPFILPGEYLDRSGVCAATETKRRADIVFSIGKEFGFPVVNTQALFDEACKAAPSDFWSVDGIHPTPEGHQLIADAWLDAYKTL